MEFVRTDGVGKNLKWEFQIPKKLSKFRKLNQRVSINLNENLGNLWNTNKSDIHVKQFRKFP